MKTDADAPRSAATVGSCVDNVDIYAAKPPASGSRLLFGADNLFRKLLILSLVRKIGKPQYHIKTSTVPLELIVSTLIPDYRYKHYNEYRSEGAHNHM